MLSSLFLFGKELENVKVLAYDFKNFPNLDGLLGWDLIQRLHLELNGPEHMLRVF